VTREGQLAWERRWARPAGTAAVAAILLQFVSAIVLAGALGDVEGVAEELVAIDGKLGSLLAAGALFAASLACLALALAYLHRATRFRRPEGLRGALVILAIGATALAVVAIARWFALDAAAADFRAGEPIPGVTSDARAEDVVEDGATPLLRDVGRLLSLALGFGVLAISLNAMRAGLVSRFLGVIGIVVGVLYALPQVAGGPQIVQLFWLGALAALFFDRYPGGRGPAWASGEAEPWPSAGARERLEELGIDRGGSNGRGAEPASADPDVPRATPRPSSRKRKRKGKRR
jgi:hypothetical protein